MHRTKALLFSHLEVIFEVIFCHKQSNKYFWMFSMNFPNIIFFGNLKATFLPRNYRKMSDILADSKTKAILFHGGLLTTQGIWFSFLPNCFRSNWIDSIHCCFEYLFYIEAIWRGVPMIIVPLAYDQHQV